MTRKERESVEDAIVEDQLRKLNAECEAEVARRYRVVGAVTGRFPCSQPNLSHVPPFAADLVACSETNS